MLNPRRQAPTAPPDYQAATRRERRATDLVHNRRLGWMLSLARDHGILPGADTPIDVLVDLVLAYLPGDFPDTETARQYVTDQGDRALALQVLNDT